MTNLGKFLVGACAGGVFFCLAAPAQADTKFELGLRSGYGIALGKADEEANGKLNETIKGQVPLWFDVGARFSDHYYLGAYFSYGFGIKGDFVKSTCAASEAQAKAAGTTLDMSCSTDDMRLGIQYLFHLKPPGQLDPYFGIGFGYEWMSMTATASAGGVSASSTATAHGFEFLNVQLGLDVPTADKFAIGPFAAFALGEYSSVSLSTDAGSASGDVANKALHEWLFLGVRGTFVM